MSDEDSKQLLDIALQFLQACQLKLEFQNHPQVLLLR